MREKLTSAERKSLTAFLASPERPENTLRYHELQGFLYAIATAPQLVLPSKWLPAIFDHAEIPFEDQEEAQVISQSLMGVYNETVKLSHTGSLPADCTIHENALENIGPDAPLGQWADGFLTGQDWINELWDSRSIDETQVEVLLELALILRIFSDPDFSAQIHEDLIAEVEEETGEPVGEEAREPMRSLLVSEHLDRLPDALAAYSQMAWSLIRGPKAVDSAGARPKVGRNAPCPCGSGRKFKKCCGA